MGTLKELVQRLQAQFAGTPGTPVFQAGVPEKPSIHAGCTPGTPGTPKNGKGGDAYACHHVPASIPAPARTPAQAANDPTVEDWRALDKAYMGHHVQCPQCQAAGRRRGDRCAVGAALWRAYEAAPVPWQIPASVKRQETTQKDQNLDALHWAAMRACDFWGDSEAQQQAMREWCDLVPPAERTAWINYFRTIYPMEGQPWSSN